MAYNYYVYNPPVSQTDLTAEMHKYYLEDVALGPLHDDGFLVSHYPSLNVRVLSPELNSFVEKKYGKNCLFAGLYQLTGDIHVYAGIVHVANLTKEQATSSVSSDGCKVCGNPGSFIRLALMCPEHGLIGGL